MFLFDCMLFLFFVKENASFCLGYKLYIGSLVCVLFAGVLVFVY